MIRTMKGLILVFLTVVITALVACGGTLSTPPSASREVIMEAPVAVERIVAMEDAAKAVEVVVERAVVSEVIREVENLVTPTRGESAVGRDDSSFVEEQVASLVSQRRIIVRTAEIQLVVSDVSGALDTISAMAQDFGGWVVSSDRSARHRGFISVRVPADRLSETMLRLRELAVEVDAELITSRDVTDQYVDNTSRLKNLQATEVALLRLLDRAAKVEDALDVQDSLTEVQAQIEVLQGRVKFLEETSAFSLVNVDLELQKGELSVDGGPDRTFSIGQPARFQARFEAPEGIEDFRFTWDFGDGSRLVTGTRTAPTLEEDIRVTATVAHAYSDDEDSPFIAEVEITGTGDAGVVEGSDTIIATVTTLPSIQVFAGADRIVDEDEQVEYSGSFTRPEGVSDLTFRWDFGDGSAPVTGSLDEGITKASAAHDYADHRPFAYTATLTITGQSEVGEVEGSSSVSVLVRESAGYVIAGWSAADAGKTAVRALSGVGQGILIFLVWFGIFSPVWIVGGVIVWRLRRRSR